MKRLPFVFLLTLGSLLPLLSACSGDDAPPTLTPDAGTAPLPPVQVTHSAESPLTLGGGDVLFVDEELALVATSSGIAPFTIGDESPGRRPAGFSEWTLSSGGFGSAVTGMAVATLGSALTPVVFFLPAGAPQVGALLVRAPAGPPAQQGALLGEAILATPLRSMFPSAIVAPAAGPASSTLWVADAVFGPNGVIRAYSLAFGQVPATLTEDANKSYTPSERDLDGQEPQEVPVLARLAFNAAGDVGLASYTVLGGTAIGCAGGVDAFDPENGELLGSVVVPNSDTATTTQGFVSAVQLYQDLLLVIVAEKGAMFEEIGGQLAVYQVESLRPFRVIDADPSRPYDQPSKVLATSLPNPVGLLVDRQVALVVAAPYLGQGVLDRFDLAGELPVLATSLPLGAVYSAGLSLPGDPKLSADGSQILIGTEAGVLRLSVGEP